jgi:hypothetical protein
MILSEVGGKPPALHKENTVNAKPANPCACSLVVTYRDETGEPVGTGCTATTRRTFAPGHDARLKGFLIKAGIADQLVSLGDDVNTDPETLAARFGFAAQVTAGITRGKERIAAREFAAMLRDIKAESAAS